MINEEIIISFIVPVYNSELYLNDCLVSLSKIENKKVEFILVNDGSTDTSLSICDEFKIKDNRFSVLTKENGGVASARNAGIDIAKGLYLFFIDNDDFIQNLEIDTLLKMIENGFCPDIILNKYKVIDYYSNKEYVNNIFERERIEGKKRSEVLDYFRESRINIYAPWEYIAKRDIYMNNSIKFSQKQNGVDDSVVTPKIFTNANSFGLYKNFVYIWRNRNDSQGKKHNLGSYVDKMISTIEDLKTYNSFDKKSSEYKYICYCLYKNIFSLVGKHSQYDQLSKAKISKFVEHDGDTIKESVMFSGTIHRLCILFFGTKYGLILSYQLATLKGFIYEKILYLAHMLKLPK